MVISTRIRILLTMGAATAMLVWGPSRAGGPVEPKSDFNFTKVLGIWKEHKIEVDPTSRLTRTDKDGDVFTGAVYRITLTPPAPSGNTKIATIINSVVAMCGHDVLLLLNSKAFDEAGTLLSDTTPMRPYEDKKQDSTPPTEMYKYSCGGEKPNTKGNSTPRGNNWI